MSYHRKTMLKKEGIAWLNEKDAVWQYIIDHAYRHEDGGYMAHIFVKSRTGFENSIRQRQKGFYKYTEEEVNARRAYSRHDSKLKMFLRYLLSFIP